jgi:hypothetical protein
MGVGVRKLFEAASQPPKDDNVYWRSFLDVFVGVEGINPKASLP